MAAAADAYRAGDAELSIRHLRECLELAPGTWEALQRMSDVHADITGDLDESLRLLRCAHRLRAKTYTLPGGQPPYRLLYPPSADLASITSLERVIKREILRRGDAKNVVLYLPEHDGPRRHPLLEKVAGLVTVAARESELPLPLHAMLSMLEDADLSESLDGLLKHAWQAGADIERGWEAAGRRGLLTLSEAELESGRQYLGQLGLPKDAWFVCVDSGVAGAQTQAAIARSVTQRGGWVVRLGSAANERCSTPQVVDHPARAEDDGDRGLFLLGACRFFVGTATSGALIPGLFGVPSVLANWSPAGRRPLHAYDIYMPRLYNAGSPARLLTFGEVLAPPLGYASRYEHAQALHLQPVPNSAEEIREAVEEMLDRFDGKLSYSGRDDDLQSAFDAVAETNRCHGRARVARAFLRRHAVLLMNISIFGE